MIKDMIVEIKLIDRISNIHLKHEINLETLKHILRNNPNQFIEEIEKFEAMVKGTNNGDKLDYTNHNYHP